MYNEKVMDAFKNPKNVGEIENPDGIGTVIESHPLSGMLKVRIGEKDDQTVKIHHRDNVKVLNSPKKIDKE